ncbi:MAG: hypothetical protein KAH01_08665, partial [Caldisericia bacterium]|nr:hypothetical protein [Caldisericia bacterium]
SCITIFNSNSQYETSFPIYLPSGDHFSNIQLCISLDDQIFLRVNSFMYIYNLDGSIKKTYRLNNIPGFAGLIGNKFSPIYENTIVFKENSSSNCWIGSLEDTSGKQPNILSNNEGVPVTASDITSFNDTITILHAPFGDLRNAYSSIFNFDTSGNYLSSIELNFLTEMPTSISYSTDGYICLLCSSHYFYILDPKTNTILNEGMIDGLSWDSQYLESFSFCGNTSDSILIADPYSGILSFKSSGVSSYIPLAKNNDTFAPSRVTGDKLNIFSYDYLSNKLSYYFNDKLKVSVPLQDVLSMTKSTSYNNDVLLFHYLDDTVFIVVKHLKLSIIKYSFNSNKAELITLPSYIPPKCSVFYRSKDKTFFIFSWFDGILYSFN